LSQENEGTNPWIAAGILTGVLLADDAILKKETDKTIDKIKK